MGKNLYIYALNNTVQCIDPSSEIVPLIIVGYVLKDLYGHYDNKKEYKRKIFN
jgi:hypothetical protein